MSGETPRVVGRGPDRRLELAAGIAAIVVGLVILAAVPQLRHCVSLTLHGDFGGLRAYIRSLGVGGLLLLVGLMLGHAIVFYPSEIVTATAAYVYGFGPGLALVVGGWLVSAWLCYVLGRTVGRPLLRAVLGRRFSALEHGVEQGGTALLLSSRLIPIVPFALMGYAAGATRISLWQFSWTTVVGYLPLTVAVAYLGSRAETLSASNPLVWVAVAVLVGLLSSEWYVRHRRHRKGADPDPGQPSESERESPGQPEQAVHPAVKSPMAKTRRDGSAA
jgi:uncharacterized membrane protein YdjX (TVP38/TMEM64 family)